MKLARYLFYGSVGVYLLLLMIQVDRNLTQDLGRHVTLGKMMVETGAVPNQNIFSYTNPEFPFINHHWLSEVVFYVVTYGLGMNALLYLRNMLWLLALIIVWVVAKRQGARSEMIALVSLIVVLSYANRMFIRPELFGFVLFSVCLWYVLAVPKQWRFYLALPIILALWVNLHLTFVFGAFLVFLLALRTRHDRRGAIAMGSLFMLLLNPSGLRGALYPLTLFGNYGFAIVENMSIPFLIQRLGGMWYWYLLALVVAGYGCAVIAFIQKKRIEALLLLLFGAASFMQIRHFPFLALVMCAVVPSLIGWYRIRKPIVLIVASAIVVMISIFIPGDYFYNYIRSPMTFGWGISDPYARVVHKAKQIRLPGNMINNFDIAGYLIYGLYPQKKVFVDNRPEAYPASFFREVYLPLLVDERLRDKVFRRYDIRTILMSHTDQTNGIVQFISAMLTTYEWKLVYLDPYAFMMVYDSAAVDLRTRRLWYVPLADRASSETELLQLSTFMYATKDKEALSYLQMVSRKRYPESCTQYRIAYLYDAPQREYIVSHYPHCF